MNPSSAITWAAHNISHKAATALLKNKVKWDNQQGVLLELDCQQKTGGFAVPRSNAHFVGKHWVPLVSISDSHSRWFYDDTSAMKIWDFDAANERLLMMHGKTVDLVKQI